MISFVPYKMIKEKKKLTLYLTICVNKYWWGNLSTQQYLDSILFFLADRSQPSINNYTPTGTNQRQDDVAEDTKQTQLTVREMALLFTVYPEVSDAAVELMASMISSPPAPPATAPTCGTFPAAGQCRWCWCWCSPGQPFLLFLGFSHSSLRDTLGTSERTVSWHQAWQRQQGSDTSTSAEPGVVGWLQKHSVIPRFCLNTSLPRTAARCRSDLSFCSTFSQHLVTEFAVVLIMPCPETLPPSSLLPEHKLSEWSGWIVSPSKPPRGFTLLFQQLVVFSHLTSAL